MTPAGYTETALVEQPAIALLDELGWETVNALHEFDHGESILGRETRAEVILTARLGPALQKLNPDSPLEAINQAIEELTRARSRMSLAAANREIYHLLKNGVRVRAPDPEGDGETIEAVRVVDWDHPAGNDFLLCSQFCVSGEMHTCRADLVGFVNGHSYVRQGAKVLGGQDRRLADRIEGPHWGAALPGNRRENRSDEKDRFYGAGRSRGDEPVEGKAALLAALRQALEESRGLCRENGVFLEAIYAIAEKIRALTPSADISQVMQQVENLHLIGCKDSLK